MLAASHTRGPGPHTVSSSASAADARRADARRSGQDRFACRGPLGRCEQQDARRAEDGRWMAADPQQDDFAEYDRARFRATRVTRDALAISLSPIEIRLEPFQARLLEQIE